MEIAISTTFADPRAADAWLAHRTALAKTARPLSCEALAYPPLSTSPARHRGGHRRAQTGPTWIARPLLGRRRLENVCTSSLVFLLVVPRPQAREEAARFSGLHHSQGSQRVQAQSHGAVSTRESLSTHQAKHVAKARHKWKALPWERALVVESTRQHRARLQPENAKTFNQGHGFVVGHPWPTRGGSLPATLLPLRPIPFSRQR